MAVPITHTPTGTAWKTRSGELVRLASRAKGNTNWFCDGCDTSGSYEPGTKLTAAAQAHADACSAIHV
jgi:hypothetical protein